VVILASAVTCEPLDEINRAHVLEFHLNAREHVFPPSKNMLLMKYSMKLERLAESWASQCLLKRPDPSLYPQYSNIGYNIALSSEYNPSLYKYVCHWLDEARFYNFSANTCSDVCSHYKQVVWASSAQLGCAVHQCDGLNPQWPDPQYLTVCLYEPAGNEGDQRPYEFGLSCNRCPKGYSCQRKQCAEDFSVKDLYPTSVLQNVKDRSVPPCLPPKAGRLLPSATTSHPRSAAPTHNDIVLLYEIITILVIMRSEDGDVMDLKLQVCLCFTQMTALLSF
ncbi:unnamed protein product, partial [Hydatigera taeniaeformis]|uniref:SCP domain-containing protein n=1 Tax=Hydatigena taeniaeformis TaxID=6205 RepID=A0A0R3WWG5_HYDTA